MDRFPDGVHVWLRSRVRGRYLFADDDGSGVYLSRCGEKMNAAWRVQRVVTHDGTPCFLLQSAAYGRYLALSPFSASHGHRGHRAILRNFREPQQRDIRWRAIAAGDGSEDVLLCTLEDQDPFCNSDLGGRTDCHRRIRYMRTNNEGNFLGTRTFKLQFLGRSVFNLRREVAKKLDVNMFTIALCVHAGFYGQLTPLVVDLPRSDDPLDIVVFPTSSPAATAFVYPDIGPPPAPPLGIDFLTDGAFVGLKCRVRGQTCYLHAEGDGVGVNLSPGATSLQNVWAVHKLEIDGAEFLLFRGAAYGRYFALMPEGKTHGSRFAQVNYDDPEQSNLLWVATSLKGSNNKVTLSSGNGSTSLGIEWTVEVVPTSPTPPALPLAAPAAVSLAVLSNSNFLIFVFKAPALDVSLFVLDFFKN